MKNRIIKILALCFIFQLLIVNFAVSQSSQNTDVNLQVETGVAPVCNSNGVCQAGRGENELTCPTDCGCNNNSSCEPLRGENVSNCYNDCYVAPPVTPVSPGGGGIVMPGPFRIINVVVDQVTDNSAKVSWVIESPVPAICKVFLGTTENYEKETISGNAFSKFHSTYLSGLLPSTIYHFKISCQDMNFNEAKTDNQQFATLPALDDEPPSNISNFEAISQDKQLKLTWQNPLDSDFKEVRIFRSENFYPTSPEEGALIYIGDGHEVEDLNLKNGTAYYYIAFAYDKAGNQSSGALTFGVPGGAGVSGEPPVKPPVGPAPPEVQELSIKDFDFFQAGKQIFPTDDNKLVLDSINPVTVSIDYEKVPEVLKTIMLSLQKGDKYFSFLLRVDKAKTKYLATINPPEPGIYPLSIYVLNYKEQALKKIDSTMFFQANIVGQEKTFTSIIKIIKNYWPNLILLIIILIAIGLAIENYKKKKQLG